MVRDCSSCFWKFWHARFLLGVKFKGGVWFGEGKKVGGAAMIFSIGMNVVSREISLRGKITKYLLEKYVRTTSGGGQHI